MASPDDPLVSVITPVYNGAEFLPKCIESVIGQTYRNWRYHIVNNCSTDRSLEIARAYAERDGRIRVHDCSQFLPVIENHNRAISLLDAEAAYCKPLMADDWLYPECLVQMVALARAHPSLGLVCSYVRTNRDVRCTAFMDRGELASVMSGAAACREALLGPVYFFGSPTATLIRADLIRKRTPFYNPENLHADTEACYDILQESDFGLVHQILAYVRLHERSQTAKVADLESALIGRVYSVAKYGRRYLTGEEFETLSRRTLNNYYSRLAIAALRMRGKEFWDFHRSKLASMGISLDRIRLARAIMAYAARRALSPVSVAHSICLWWPAALRSKLRKSSK